MCTFFNYIPAKKNKGLILQVIPKLVEGSSAKYITGSGQTQATKDRVLIYELEGGVKPFHRGRESKASVQASMIEQPVSRPSKSLTLQTKSRKQSRYRRDHQSNTDSGSSDDDWSSSAPTSQAPNKRARLSVQTSIETFTPTVGNQMESVVYLPEIESAATDEFSIIDLGIDKLDTADSIRRSYSWGKNLVGADSYLAYQEKFKDDLHAFPHLIHSQISVENLLFPGELIGTEILEIDANIF